MEKLVSNGEFDKKIALTQQPKLIPGTPNSRYLTTLFILDVKIYLEYWGEKPGKREIVPSFLGWWRI